MSTLASTHAARIIASQNDTPLESCKSRAYSRTPFVSRAIMQLSSRGQRPVRGELHAGDAGLQLGQRIGTLGPLFVDWLDDNPDALILAEIEIARWLENPARV